MTKCDGGSGCSQLLTVHYLSLSLWFHWASVETRHLTIVTDVDVTLYDWWYHFSSEFTDFVTMISMKLDHKATVYDRTISPPHACVDGTKVGQVLTRASGPHARTRSRPGRGPSSRAKVLTAHAWHSLGAAWVWAKRGEGQLGYNSTMAGWVSYQGMPPPKIDYYGTEISPVDNVNIYT